MNGENSSSGLTIIAMLVGIMSGIVTIITFFFSDKESLLEALGEVLPGMSELFTGLAGNVAKFTEAWPLGPLISAILIFFIVVILRIIAEEVYFSDDMLIHAVIFLPLPLLWIWIFSGVINTLSLVIFIIGYLVSLFVWPFSLFIYEELKEQKRKNNS